MSPDSEEKAQFHCQHCGATSLSEVIATHRWTERPDPIGEGHGPDYRYRFVSCASCDDASLLLAMSIGRSQSNVEILDADVSVYPAAPQSLSGAVPKSLQDCFSEARACYQARAYTAAAIMCRRALELLSHERGVTERDLATSLEKLRARGDLDQRLYDWCDALRLAGNRAAHEVGSEVSQADARGMSDLAEAIIDYVYVFQARYERFNARRKAGQRPAQ